MHHILATLVIVKAPKFMAPITIPGYHIHFISKDHKKLGHVYDLRFNAAIVRIEPIERFTLLLPDTKGYRKANLIARYNQTSNKIVKP